MNLNIKSLLAAIVGAAMMMTSTAQAEDYQAHWTGKYFMIIDSDSGNIWSYFGDQLIYNGRLDGDDFDAPENIKIWNLKHGKWEKN